MLLMYYRSKVHQLHIVFLCTEDLCQGAWFSVAEDFYLLHFPRAGLCSNIEKITSFEK